jgi:nucleoside-diphosphate-sugar epimerase
MAGELVFITGGTGHLGYAILFEALNTGYRVRATVRSQDKANKVLAAPSLLALKPGKQLEFALIPDILAEGAYDEAVKGATYIIHVASPVPKSFKEGDDAEKHFVNGAVKATMNILTAAQKSGTVKRVVITSSIGAIISFKELTSGTSETIFNEKSRTEFIPGPYGNSLEAYAASKVKALNETEA